MKVTIGQTNPTPGDFKGNVDQILNAIDVGSAAGASLVVTPEMGIPGYLCRDSMYEHGFIEKNLAGLGCVVEKTRTSRNISVVVGYVDRNNSGVGKPFRNMAAVVRDGCIVATYAKQLLPFYDVFDEGRYFEPGSELAVVEIQGVKWGILICEDGWENDKGSAEHNHHNDPIERYRSIGVKNLIWINSSPYVIGKPRNRSMMVSRISLNNGMVIYANQFGGMDDLVFDGNSLVARSGAFLYACGTGQGTHVIDLNGEYGFQSVSDDITDLKGIIETGLRDYIQKTGFERVVVASSGGIDSALVLCQACAAIGPKNVHAIRMPSIHSSQGSMDDALKLHQNLGCHDYFVPIDLIADSADSHIERIRRVNAAIFSRMATDDPLRAKYNKVADENWQARERARNLMHFSNGFGAMALTTSNKSESAVGYCTLGGDCMGGFAPIQDLYKTQVYKVAALYEAMTHEIMKKAPSAELAPGQTDEASLLPYALLDLIIYAYVEGHVSLFDDFKRLPSDGFPRSLDYDEGMEVQDNLERSGEIVKKYDRIIRLIDLSEFKRRQVPPGIKISKVAFGSGRRFPIVRRRG